MWAFGRGPNSTQIGAWWSTDLVSWKQGPGLQLTGFGADNAGFIECIACLNEKRSFAKTGTGQR
jgi:hypothetical protein